MRLGGNAKYLAEVTEKSQIAELVGFASEKSLRIIMVGTGTNIVWKDEGFDGLLLVNKLKGTEDFEEDSENFYVTVAAGEIWDDIVKKYTDLGYSGIEALSLIPGKVGAIPVQNVGAYGQEISNVLVSVEAYDTKENKLVNIPNPDCEFGYRTSRFKEKDRGRFLITAITLHLTKRPPSPPFYSSVERYLDEHKITNVTAQLIREIVIDIRSSKLPDPAKVANNGSFFKNPIIDADALKQIQYVYSDMPYWPLEENKAKLSAAWLVETVGFKGFKDTETGMAVWPKQALILVNEHAKSTADLLKFKKKITDAVKNKFEVTLEQEPELLP